MDQAKSFRRSISRAFPREKFNLSHLELGPHTMMGSCYNAKQYIILADIIANTDIFVSAYRLTYILVQFLTFLLTCLLLTCLLATLLTYLLACLLNDLITCLLVYLIHCLLTTNLLVCLFTHLLSCLHA